MTVSWVKGVVNNQGLRLAAVMDHCVWPSPTSWTEHRAGGQSSNHRLWFWLDMTWYWGFCGVHCARWDKWIILKPDGWLVW